MQRDERAPKTHGVLDWIDVVLAYGTLCMSFGVAAALHVAGDGRIFKLLTALAVLAALIARRALIGPPRASTVQRGKTAMGLLGAASLIVGLILGTIGGAMVFDASTTPLPEPAKIDHDAIEREVGLPLGALGRTCTQGGKPARGRACMTAAERAEEATRDEAIYAEQRARDAAERSRQLGVAWKIAGVGTLLVLLGIGLDVLRTRRDAAEG